VLSQHKWNQSYLLICWTWAGSILCQTWFSSCAVTAHQEKDQKLSLPLQCLEGWPPTQVKPFCNTAWTAVRLICVGMLALYLRASASSVCVCVCVCTHMDIRIAGFIARASCFLSCKLIYFYYAKQIGLGRREDKKHAALDVMFMVPFYCSHVFNIESSKFLKLLFFNQANVGRCVSAGFPLLVKRLHKNDFLKSDHEYQQFPPSSCALL